VVNRIAFGPAPLLLSALLLAGCAPSVPARWAEGGAPLQIAPARWQRGDADPVEIQADGRVLEGGKLRFTVDRVGRVTDDDYDAFAVLLPDGHVVGTDDRALGYVGVNNATPPFAAQAWLSIAPDGRVVFFNQDGDRSALGQWTGCNGPNRRTCTLVTQIFLVQNFRDAPMYGPTFGVGVGVGFGF
jgi:hypothetical protein